MITQCFISRSFSSFCNITSYLLLLHLQLLKLLLKQRWKKPELGGQKKRKNKVTPKKAPKRSPEKSMQMSLNNSAKMSTWTPRNPGSHLPIWRINWIKHERKRASLRSRRTAHQMKFLLSSTSWSFHGKIKALQTQTKKSARICVILEDNRIPVIPPVHLQQQPMLKPSNCIIEHLCWILSWRLLSLVKAKKQVDSDNESSKDLPGKPENVWSSKGSKSSEDLLGESKNDS